MKKSAGRQPGMPRRMLLSAWGLAAAPLSAQQERAGELEQARLQVRRNAEALRKLAAARDLEPAFRFEA